MPDVSSDGAADRGTLDSAYDFGGDGAGRIITVDSGAVVLTDGGTLPAISADTLLVVAQVSAVGDNVGISIISGNIGNSILAFGDGDDENVAFIDVDHNIGRMTITAETDVFFTTNVLATDGAVDLGESGANRFRTAFFETSVVIGDASGAGATLLSGTNNLGNASFRFDHTGSDAILHLFDDAGTEIVTISTRPSTATVFNENGGNIDFRVEGDSLERLLATDASLATENVMICADAAPDFQTMDRGMFWGDRTTAPTGNPTAGAFVWSDGGTPNIRTSGGLTGPIVVGGTAAYTRDAVIVEDRTLLASASATTLNNNNVLAALIADLTTALVIV